MLENNVSYKEEDLVKEVDRIHKYCPHLLLKISPLTYHTWREDSSLFNTWFCIQGHGCFSFKWGGLVRKIRAFPHLVSSYHRQLLKNRFFHTFFHIPAPFVRSELYPRYYLFLPPLMSFWDVCKVTWWRTLQLSRLGSVVFGLRAMKRGVERMLKVSHSAVKHWEVPSLSLLAQSYQRSKRKVSAKVQGSEEGNIWLLWTVASTIIAKESEKMRSNYKIMG